MAAYSCKASLSICTCDLPVWAASRSNNASVSASSENALLLMPRFSLLRF
nr:MAG TPA: hypothetical protein [Siphoviridae sp. ctJJg9]DAX88677.1 MAG TPA: hypothetical protein [Caudoviricetes sp.]